MADQKSRLMPTAQTYALSTNPGSFCAHGQPLQPHAEGWLRLRQFTHKFWILEALASILSLVLFAVIVAVLLFYDNRIYGVSTRQSDGMKRPHVFFYLAFLSAVMRATMLLPVAAAIGQLKWSWFRSPQRLVDIERFNEAAGGILGSAKLMFTLRFRHAAAIGAALTILALPLDAIIQTAVLLPSKLVNVSDLDATSHRYSGYYRNESKLERAVTYTENQRMTDGNNFWPSTAMVNAILFGQTYSSGPANIVTAVTKVDCPTGYCNFKKTQTLAIGRQCVRRTDVVYVPGNAAQAAYQTLPGTNLRYYLNGTSTFERQFIAAQSYSNWPLPNSTFPEAIYSHGDYAMDMFNSTILQYDPTVGYFDSNLGPIIMRTAMLLDTQEDTDTAINNGTYGAECVLYWYIKTHQVYVNASTNFQFGETADVRTPMTFTQNNYSTLIMTPQTCIVEGETIPPSDDAYYKNNCVYKVGLQARLGLRNMLWDPYYGLVGNLTRVATTTNSEGETFYTWNRRSLFALNINEARNKNSTVTNNYINWIWSNIAFATTATIRQAASAQTDMESNTIERERLFATGAVSVLVFSYDVDWARLIMPAVLVVCCAVFVLFTALHTKNEYAWRQSSLPLLFHGLEDQERLAQGDVRDFNVMQDVARKIRVQLTEHVDANGARFTTCG